MSLCGAMGKRGSAGIPGSPPGRRLRKQLSGEGGDDDAPPESPASTPNTRTLRAVARYKQKYGHSPSQTSKDVDERRLAVRLSKVPRHRKQSLKAENKAENQRSHVEETLHACFAFLEAHGSVPQRTEDPARADENKLALKFVKIKRMPTETFTPDIQNQIERLLVAEKKPSLQGNTGCGKLLSKAVASWSSS